MKTWIISDTHFYHDNMVKLCGRPDDFTEQIWENLIYTVKHDDLLIHLGDVTWDKNVPINSLPGRKVLVKGNHDKHSYSWYMNNGFDFCCEQFSMFIGGMNIVFTHKPLIFHEFDINIHGHLHNRAKVESVCKHYCVALEETGYKPLLLSDLLPKLQKEVKDE